MIFVNQSETCSKLVLPWYCVTPVDGLGPGAVIVRGIPNKKPVKPPARKAELPITRATAQAPHLTPLGSCEAYTRMTTTPRIHMKGITYSQLNSKAVEPREAIRPSHVGA